MSPTMDRLQRGLIAACGGLALVAFFASWLQRLPTPIELGGGEGTLLDHAIRFATGKPVFLPPSFEFIPLAYMPGMPLLAAPFVRLLGPQFWIGRLLDGIAIALLCAQFVRAMRRETGDWTLGMAAAGIFVMGQGFTLGNYDVFRPDPVMLCLAFAGAATLRFSRGTAGAVGAAALFTAGFLFKQHAMAFAAAMLPYLFLTDRRRLLPFAIALLVFAGGSFLLLRAWLGPWFVFYCFEVPSKWSEFSRARVQHYLTVETFGRFAMLTVPATLAIITRPWRERPGIWWWFALGGFVTGLMSTLDPYAFLHTLVPSLCAYAFVGPLALQRLWSVQAGDRRRLFGWAAVMIIALQIVALPFSPRALRPHPGSTEALRDFIGFLRAQPRRTLVFHGLYTTLAGEGTTLSILSMDDVVRAHHSSLVRRDPGYFDRMFATLRSGPDRPILVTDTTLDALGDRSRAYWASLQPGYRLVGTLGPLAARIRPVVGQHDTPRYIYAPVDSLGVAPYVPPRAGQDATPR